jgi:exosortase A-associated hydrolase 2
MGKRISIVSTIMPLCISGQTGDLFGLYYPPVGFDQPNQVILYIPPFAEEMNKSRRMVALQARAFAQQGYGVLVVDLLGTGDSAGNFSDATWLIWQQDIDAAIQWLLKQGAKSISLWGLRMGVLLAMDFIANTGTKIDKLIGWQPVLNGETFVMQFLRLRVAAAVMDRNAPQEKTSDLKQQLLDGRAIEVAGYLLNPSLIKPMLALNANNLDLTAVKNLLLFEIVTSADKTVSPVNAKFIETLNRKNQSAVIKTIIGSPFWSTQEIVEVPQLLTETVNSLNKTIQCIASAENLGSGA